MGTVVRIGLWAVLVLFLGAVMSIILSLVSLSGAFVKKQDPSVLAEALAEHMTITTPPGPGPFPTVIQFHGCGGLEGPDGVRQPIMEEYAEAAVANGIAAVTVESFPHRGIGRTEALARVCSGQALRGAERAGDVLAALDHVRTLDFVRKDKIALAGWSHGGWAVMDLMAMDLMHSKPHNLTRAPEDGLRGVAAVYLTYPYAGFIARTQHVGWAARPPTRVILSELDTVVPNEGAQKSIEAMRETGVPVDVRVYEGLDHAFDERFLEPGSSLVFHEDQAAIARAEYGAWLAETLGAASPGVMTADAPGDDAAQTPDGETPSSP